MKHMDNLHGAALDAGGVKFDFETGYPFVSGIQAPIYVDTRKLFFDPAIRDRVIATLVEHIQSLNLDFDIVAGVESGAIAPAVLVASALKKRFVYIKKQAKDHGLKRMIECGDVAGAKVLLVEDLVSTGLSSLNAVKVIRDAGGSISEAVSIHLYDFPETAGNFEKEQMTLHPIVRISQIAEEAVRRGIVSEENKNKLLAWLPKPYERW